MSETNHLLSFFNTTRSRTEEICRPLETEDYVVQPQVDVSPPKWHLGHTTWFFEEFILAKFHKNYQRFHPEYAFVFNSYYESLGKRVVRTNRGNLSRPTVAQVYEYRKHVTSAMSDLIDQNPDEDLAYLVTIGIHHEKQHQELLLTDIKFILGNNPLLPEYHLGFEENVTQEKVSEATYISIQSGLYEIGHQGTDFCYDNELGRHKIYLEQYEIAAELVINADYLDFMKDGGYEDALLWHAEGWDWVQQNKITVPLYWHYLDGAWHRYALNGLRPLVPNDPVTHISYYEAFAFAQWSGKRLPTEFEWEAAQNNFSWGARWEWTESAYLPYPGYTKAAGALGEYNGKFMINQKVLRGASIATPDHHARPTYRNFFHPQLRWQFTGLRLAK